MQLQQMEVHVEDSTSMACFYVCCMGVFKAQTGIVFPLHVFFKDWSFRRTPYAAYTDFSNSQKLLAQVDGIRIERLEAPSLNEMVEMEKELIVKEHYPISSVDSFYLPYHPYFEKIHVGHFVVPTRIESGEVHIIDVELKQEHVFTLDQWFAMRTYAENQKVIDIFEVFSETPRQMTMQEQLAFVCGSNATSMLATNDPELGLTGMLHVAKQLENKEVQAIRMFSNHYGMRTSRTQHAKYLLAAAEQVDCPEFKQLAEQVLELAGDWGKLHFTCSKYQFSQSESLFMNAAAKLYAIAETEQKLLMNFLRLFA